MRERSMRLDVGTLAFTTSVLSLALAAATAFIATGRGARLTRVCFSGSAALYGLGLLCIVFWPTTPLCLVTGNALVMGSALCAHAGACLYAGRTVHPLSYGAGMVAVLLGLALSFMEGGGGTAARIIVISALRIPFFLHAAAVIYAASCKTGRRPVHFLLMGIFFCFSLVLILRIWNVLSSDAALESYLDAMGFLAIYYLAIGVFMLSMSIAFLMICSEQDERRLRETIAEQTLALRDARDQAEAASLAKSRFIAAVSHDLRQPVHTLRLLLAAAEQAPELEQRDLLTQMRRATGYLADSLHALLDLSKMDAGLIVPTWQDVSLGPVLEELEARFAPEARVSGGRLTVVASSAVVRTDPVILKRILANLMANALAAARGGVVLVGCRRRGAFLEIQVCDDGPGIDSRLLADVFDEEGPALPAGGGMGLTIVRRLADLLGHPVLVHSQPGRGTLFALRVPVGRGQA
ncbi:sensor histidine kinase [Pararhodospirillum photometricum]|uniref:sensor histidine kinase n=1 Tax=Pararhodospirillum photometricum TaxID=1084 RepID=UPI0012FEE8C9|nr:HAMP domain-containing sensor histidine kinase [Pararhodospirillum photometricum]